MHAFVPSGAQPASDASSQLKAAMEAHGYGKGEGGVFLVTYPHRYLRSLSFGYLQKSKRERKRDQEGREEWRKGYNMIAEKEC